MPDIIVEFSHTDIAELLAKAATLAVGKEGFTAGCRDVVLHIDKDSQCVTARVKVRNTGPR
jgi:hypothetical protein